MTAYYNEFDPDAAAWLRELITDGLIAPGDVDERSIIDVSADDVKGYEQCHWFAGIGGWSYALRLAGWPDDKPVWTASLPCQPFSTAGKRLGKEDERHLLPHFISLVAQCSPSVLFGEQVSAAIKHCWLDDLYSEMEAHNYAVGSVVIGAHSIGAAHIRQRLYWVADSQSERIGRTGRSGDSKTGTLADSRGHENWESVQSIARSSIIGMADSISIECVEQGNGCGNKGDAGAASGIDAYCSEYESIEWLYCRDNKYRPIESGLKPMVDAVPRGMVHSSDPRNTQEARVMRLKGYGNAIVPTLAAEFIGAYAEIQLGK